jgi:PAS domain S-box-containing protein
MRPYKSYIPPKVTRYRSEVEYPEWTKQTVQVVRQEMELKPSVLSSVDPHYVAILDSNRQYIQVSDNFCLLLGYPRQELIGKKLDDLTAPETNDIAKVFELFSRLGYMHGLWMLVARKGTRILVRYESWIRPDALFEGHMEVVGAGY